MSDAARRQLFVYWKTSRDAAAAAATAAMAMQAALRHDHPGLRAALYRRSEGGSDDEVTLMEVYSGASGVDAALQETIGSAAAQQLAPYLRGARHTEVFSAL